MTTGRTVRAARRVKGNDSYLDETGTLVVPLDKATIKHAPKANREHVMTTETRREVRDYYSVAA